jgi:hypothetical protein
MQKKLLKVVFPFAAVLLGAGGSAFAANTSSVANADRTLSQSQPPVDCKKTPEDPSCKDKR